MNYRLGQIILRQQRNRGRTNNSLTSAYEKVIAPPSSPFDPCSMKGRRFHAIWSTLGEEGM